MKLLFDENLSPHLVQRLSAAFPESEHVGAVGLKGRGDDEVWRYAGRLGFTIVSKDNDFRQRVFLLGPPPKVIWLSVGNAGTGAIAALLQSRLEALRSFLKSDDGGLLVVEFGDGPVSKKNR